MKNLALFWLLLAFRIAAAPDLPSQFDLRNVNGQDYVTGVRNQNGGTCWTHGTMAAIEGNLMRTGAWTASGETGEAALAEYHLDWWNGFNRHYNADIAPATGGLQVHQGGDYHVAAAYLARGGGAVRKVDGQSYQSPPDQTNPNYHVFYVRDIEWLTGGSAETTKQKIKQALIDYGVVATALAWDDSFYSTDNNTFYQPPSDDEDANHAVAIVGWDDNKRTQANQPGAWLIKNSWGTDWGDGGFFWISYDDKITGHHPEMGAVSFRGAERLKYNQIYYHDYHGWRDTKPNVSEAFNHFTATASPGNQSLSAVSFYTSTTNVQYAARIFRKFENGQLDQMVSEKEGVIPEIGFHTVDLDWPVPLQAGDDFYVYVRLSQGGQAYDHTSDVPVLLGVRYRSMVGSVGHPGDSYYRSAGVWKDIYNDDKSAKFCLKALAVGD